MSETSTRATAPAVSVVVPVRNEAGNVAPLVNEIFTALEGRWSFEVVYVNDGSSDGTRRSSTCALFREAPASAFTEKPAMPKPRRRISSAAWPSYSAVAPRYQ